MARQFPVGLVRFPGGEAKLLPGQGSRFLGHVLTGGNPGGVSLDSWKSSTDAFVAAAP